MLIDTISFLICFISLTVGLIKQKIKPIILPKYWTHRGCHYMKKHTRICQMKLFDIGKRIRELRKEQGLTEEELA